MPLTILIFFFLKIFEIGSKVDSISSEFETQKISAKNLESNFDQKMEKSSAELKCIKTDLSAFNQVNKDFLHVVKVDRIVSFINILTRESERGREREREGERGRER